MHGRIIQVAAVAVTFTLLITGCTSQASNIGMAKDKEGGAVDTGFTVAAVGSYDSADTAVVMATDPQNNSVTFMNMSTGRQYTLYYDGTTYVKDRYESPMTISQIRAGDVVDVNFLKGKRQIASIQLSPAAWVYDNVENYDFGGINKTASIGSATYSLPDDVVILSDGKRVEVMDIVKQDVVSIQGIDHKIYSVNVERGHGYLRLKNDQPLIGGWIEVGNTVIREITEDMLLVVPEGDYQVFLSNNGAACTKSVTIERDKEVVLDVGDLEVPENRTGRILFSVTPENAKVTIDHKEVDISSPIELQYGIHQVHLEASGYDSLTKYIQVGSEYAKISFTLEEQKENDVPSISQNDLEVEEPDLLTDKDKPKADNTISANDLSSVSDNTLSASKVNKVYINSPKGVEVYLDGNYVGVSPVKFKKVAGSHTITLRKSGYMTKSYTIYLYDDKEDITYSFTALEKENPNQGSSVSDNTTSAGTTSDKTTSTGTTSSGTTSTGTTSSGTTSGDSSGEGGNGSNPNDPSGGAGGGTGNEGEGGNGGGTGNEGEGGNGGGTGNEGEGGNGGGTGNEGEGGNGDGTGNEGEGGNGGGTGNEGEGGNGGGTGNEGEGGDGSGSGNEGGGGNGDGTGTGNEGEGGNGGETGNEGESGGEDSSNIDIAPSGNTTTSSVTSNMEGIVTNSVGTFNKVKSANKSK